VYDVPTVWNTTNQLDERHRGCNRQARCHEGEVDDVLARASWASTRSGSSATAPSMITASVETREATGV
jgi:hypothetical protein